jgi:hypothetical protein
MNRKRDPGEELLARACYLWLFQAVAEIQQSFQEQASRKVTSLFLMPYSHVEFHLPATYT